MHKSLTILLLFLITALPLYPQSEPDRYNVLFIISDDLNTRIGPFMDLENHTPNLDQLAASGVSFTRAYAQYPICGPSRASIMSGLYPETNGVLNNNDQPGSYRKETPALANHPSLAGFFRENGYYSARVSKIYHMGVPGGIERGDVGGDDPDSWDYTYNVTGPETLSRGELELLSPKNLHYGGNFSRMILPEDKTHTQTDYLATSQAIAILENRAATLPPGGTNKKRKKKDAPFFLAVGLVRPHVPLIAPASFYEPYPEAGVNLPEYTIGENVPEEALRRQNDKVWGMSEEQQKKVISGYMASVRFMDAQVGRLLTTLDELDLRKNTIVVFLSDHGYNLGEHDCWSKISLWEGSVRVPLIISHPDFTQQHGKKVDEIVELIDLYPTLTTLAGYKKEVLPKVLQGENLSPYIKGEAVKDKDQFAYTVSWGGRDASLRTGEFRYTRWGEGANTVNEELYHHATDPEEHINLVGNKKYAKTLESLRKQLDEIQDKAKNAISMKE